MRQGLCDEGSTETLAEWRQIPGKRTQETSALLSMPNRAEDVELREQGCFVFC